MSTMSSEDDFDVIVIGGGHAGTEAAVMAARAGAQVALITSALETIGQMSCNPAIGGIAKGTVVREVDAFGGVMAKATDLSMVQFRMLNRSKGPAVWAPRAQCDRGLYRRAVRMLIEQQPRLATIQGTVASFVFHEGKLRGVRTIEGRSFGARAVIVTSGTFLRGRIHIGTDTQIAGGRAAEAPATHLAIQLEEAGLQISRFKTGTPPRVDGRTVDFRRLQRQESEVDAFNYSWSHYWETQRFDGGTPRHPPQLPCWITFLEHDGKDVISAHLGESAMYGGAIGSRGPRYCPSVEDKVVKFPAAVRHQIFLEPEGHDTAELYVNGLSTSLPAHVQVDVLRTIEGLGDARMTRAGYAIEYDYFPPTQLQPTLESRIIPGLFLAGQVNGTTGYEEAAGQGVVAGINAAAKVLDVEPLVLGRETSYIGVLIDDLVSRGVDEPYRLFTSRSEFRLTVRQDNALRRLGPIAGTRGLLTSQEQAILESRIEAERRALELAQTESIRPELANEILLSCESAPVKQPARIAELAKRHRVELASLLRAVGLGLDLPSDSLLTAELELKYAGYFERERTHADRLRRMGAFKLPTEAPFTSFLSLSIEARQKLADRRPPTLAVAASIPGVSPSDLQNLVIEVERWVRVAGKAEHAS